MDIKLRIKLRKDTYDARSRVSKLRDNRSNEYEEVRGKY